MVFVTNNWCKISCIITYWSLRCWLPSQDRYTQFWSTLTGLIKLTCMHSKTARRSLLLKTLILECGKYLTVDFLKASNMGVTLDQHWKLSQSTYSKSYLSSRDLNAKIEALALHSLRLSSYLNIISNSYLFRLMLQNFQMLLLLC